MKYSYHPNELSSRNNDHANMPSNIILNIKYLHCNFVAMYPLVPSPYSHNVSLYYNNANRFTVV